MADFLNATILNVNDDDASRYVASRILEMGGYRVIEAGTGHEALKLAAQHRPDLIILDVKLPDIIGYEVASRLRASPDTASISVLHTSATFVTPDKRVQGLDAGADGYLTQPFEPAELIATVRSLLRLRHAERELRVRADQLTAADRRKDEFLAMLAHELRNPLAAIMTAIGILERKPTDDVKEARMRSIIQRQTHHLARLVDDLLDVSRITRGKVELRRERLDALSVLQQVIALIRPVAEGRGLQLESTLHEGPLWVEGDPTRLEQIFMNLLDNAAKYTDAGGRIFVQASQEGVDGNARAVVRIRDTGIGIPSHKLPDIFELFNQADESLERSRGGLGIGLTLVRNLVELHGGTIGATSGGTGQGSEFVVKLPLCAAVPVKAGQPKPLDGARHRRILLVEDNSDARQALKDLLELWGHQVQVAQDGREGVALALEARPDLALVDIGLPGLDGYRVAEELRARAGQNIRLVAITGYGGPEDRSRAHQAGFDHHMVKPVKPDELNRLLMNL
ncbi:Signal transduction histidine kinase [Stigmatella aurantiaca]|uniref:histidine kinase n=1 Tax=Stigmatella aurantiaca TaxID=41 RepID=A0A1H7L5A9_STIAU|nr:response regulator [Stigmatella aurantiaca]SEK94253.1 Signal transduction histidine kinase [Stigmatella aurantiaca]